MSFFSMRLSLLSLVMASFVFGGADHAAAPKMPKAFDTLKTLVGTWEGTSEMDGKPVEQKVTYELTSGGSALLERLFVGSSHEMVSVYHADGQNVVMTHYCLLGNHPTLQLKKSDGKTFEFELKGTQGLTSKNELHMHALKIIWVDPDHIKQEWTGYENGKAKDAHTVELTRKAKPTR